MKIKLLAERLFKGVRQSFLVLTGILVLLSVGGVFLFVTKRAQLKTRPWMTIFVHGSFGTLIGLLNMSEVLGDKIAGTLYSTVAKKMRNDPFFYRDQAISHRGLVRIEPTFDIRDVGGKRMAVYPLAKAYEVVSLLVTRGREKSLFYTFGWSGLISQNSRRFEAIRFYNALKEELARLAQQGLVPRIRIISHSHGGNVSLNLSAVETLLDRSCWDETALFSSDVDENDSLQQMCKLIKSLENKEKAKQKTGQKAFDYTPCARGLIVDELILFGCPIQPETEPFVYSGMFKRVYNFYSEEDFVQRADWVSSKQSLSRQRISRFPMLAKANDKKKMARVVQVKIMSEKAVQTKLDDIAAQKQQDHLQQKKEPTVLDDILAGRNIFIRATKDPTHKELWLIDWSNEKKGYTSFLAPLPTVILTPLMIQAILRSGLDDVDVTMSATQKEVDVFISPHDKSIITARAKIPRSVIIDIQKKINQWKPDNLSSAKDFDAVYRHIAH